MAEARQEWDVHRDESGEPVTLSESQLRAITHALRVVEEVRAENDKSPIKNIHDVLKSRLLGRMLLDGRAPLKEAPEEFMGAPGYHLAEPDQSHFYLKVTPKLYKIPSES